MWFLESMNIIFRDQIFGCLTTTLISPVLLLALAFMTTLSAVIADDGQKTIKVMSYNIHYGIGMDKKLDLKRIAEVIKKEKPDIVGLQEIGNEAMAKELGELTGMNYLFGPSLGSSKGYGDAVLCIHPFKSLGNHSIPSASGSRYQAMAIDVDLSKVYGEGSNVRFINTHFDWLKTIGSEQARLATVDVIEQAFFKDEKIPSILAGDLNATPDSDPLKKLAKYGWHHKSLGKLGYTIPSANPTKEIDYLLVRPKASWLVKESKVLAEPVASDHLPVIKTLKLLK